MYIINGVLHTMDGPVLSRGYVAFEGGRITGVGPMEELEGVHLSGEVVDAQGGHIIPGMLDIHCHLGLYGSGVGFEAEDLNEMTDPSTPHLRALDGVNPLDPYFREARQAGVTCVLTGPGSTNPISGQSVLLKTVGRVVDEMVVRAPASMKFALGENPKKCYGKRDQSPMTRMGTTAIIREQLAKAMDYQVKYSGNGDQPDFDAKLEALRPLAEGKLAAHFHAHRADDIGTAVRIAREFGLEFAVVHGTEGHLVADYLAQEGVPVITGPILTDRSKPELAQLRLENTAILARAGVEVALCTDHPETPIQYLPLCAAMAAKAGLDEEEALATITCNAARIAGAGHRLGSLTVGKDADVVVLDGPPLDWRTRVVRVYINGEEVRD